jgi:hypothetical protein
MKPDLQDIVKDRSAHRGVKFRNGKGNPIRRIPLEDRPHIQSIRLEVRHVGNFHPNVHSTPMWRWLRKQVGRPWNKVFAEMCEVSDRRETPQSLIKIAGWFVSVDGVTMHDGVPYTICSGGYVKLGLHREALYVNPKTGLLCVYKAPKQEREARPVTFILIKDWPIDRKANPNSLYDGKRSGYRRMGGIWYEVVEYYGRSPLPWVMSLCDYHVVEKRQLSTKELKRLKLVNADAFVRYQNARLHPARSLLY